MAALNFNDIPADVRDHVCTCAACRNSLYEARRRRHRAVSAAPSTASFPCKEVRPADLFDFVVPYGLAPGDEEKVRFRETLASHLNGCPDCNAKLQQLHDGIYTIKEREDSDIVTCFAVNRPGQTGTDIDPDHIYAGWPVQVTLFEKNPAADTSIAAQKFKEHSLTPLWHKMVKPIAAAAVILIIAGLFFFTPAARAIQLDKIFEALKTIRHAHVQSLNRDETEVIQELWVSRSFHIYLIKTGNEWVLWDMPAGTRTTKDLETNTWAVAAVAQADRERVAQKIATFIDLLPFPEESLSTINFSWQPVTDLDILDQLPGSEVYDLTWSSETYSGTKQTNKWRGFIDPGTYLPHRVERYIKLEDQTNFTLNSVSVMDYPDDRALEIALKTAGF